MKTIALSYWHIFSEQRATKVLGKSYDWFARVFTFLVGFPILVNVLWDF